MDHLGNQNMSNYYLMIQMKEKHLMMELEDIFTVMVVMKEYSKVKWLLIPLREDKETRKCSFLKLIGIIVLTLKPMSHNASQVTCFMVQPQYAI